MLQKNLEKLGFENKEAILYTALLELGEASIVDIARKSGLKRTTVYHTLDSLKTRGLISQTKRKKKVFYIAEDPRSIEQELREKELLFKKTLPELMSIANFLERKPIIKYFEGLSGIKESYKDQLNYGHDEILTWWSESYKIFGDEFFFDYFMPERLRKKIWVRAIACHSHYMESQKKEDEKSLRKIKLANLEPTFAELDISLYGKRKVAINSFHEKFAIIIESKALYNTLKNIFELQWKNLE